ncbi:MAG: hypothetical protein C5B59_03185 [Bacteroidetes bacterium]|nr:MAG: hypothetical protein C5B59_03185 [Bacteroidota bacterium]
MKRTIIAFLFFLVSAIGIFYACKKEIKPHPPIAPPIANAGRDTTIVLTSCDTTASIMLNGSGSTDASSKISAYAWAVIQAPPLYFPTIFAPKVSLKLPAGMYQFELTVTNAQGLSAKDTVSINVIVSAYDLDINLTGEFVFYDKYEGGCYYVPCYWVDSTYGYGTGSFAPLGKYAFYVYETADTSLIKDIHTTNFGLYFDGDQQSLYGVLSTNFRTLIENGGGAFTGTFTISKGSAQGCNPNIFNGLSPLNVTGTVTITSKNLSVIAGTVSMNLKGKTYF